MPAPSTAEAPAAGGWLSRSLYASGRFAEGPYAWPILLLFALVVRLIDFELQSLRLDELASAFWSDPDQDFGAIAAYMVREDSQVPGYYALLHGWFHLFGFTQRAAEGLSVLLGALGVLAVYGAARAMGSARLALVAGAIAVVQPYLVQYSHEVRFYPLAALLTPLCYWALIRALQQPAWPQLLAWSASLLALLFTYYYGLYTGALQALLIVMWASAHQKWRSAEVQRLVLAGLLPLLLFLPVLLQAQVIRGIVVDKPGAVAPSVEPLFVLRFWAEYFGDQNDYDLDRWSLSAAAIALGLLLIAGLIRAMRSQAGVPLRPGVVLIVWVIGGFYLPYVHSLVVGNWYYWPRYAIGVLPGVAIGLAWACLWPRQGVLRLALAAVAVGLVAHTWLHPPSGLGVNEKDDFRGVMRMLAHRLDHYPIVTHLDLQANTQAKLDGQPVSVCHPTSPQGRAALDTAQGVWVMRLRYYAFADSLFDTALARDYELVRTLDDQRLIDLSLYMRKPEAGGLSYALVPQGQWQTAVPIDSLVRPSVTAVGWIDHLAETPEGWTATGWARLPSQAPTALRVWLVLQQGERRWAAPADYGGMRRDLPGRQAAELRAGWQLKLARKGLPPGRYAVGVWVMAERTGQQAFIGPIGGREVVVASTPEKP